ncbi:MAG TPA: DMT family transporter [Symbiobacteriaceae bacterium]|nr:DMT family transporter [Symbiobacteriaceae bacterium]
MNKTYMGYLLTILSAMAFAAMSLFIKMAYDAGVSAWAFTLIQSSVSLVLLGFMWLREAPHPRVRHSVPTVGFFLACGVITAIAFNIALVHLSMSLATILLFTYPAFTALGAWLMLGHRPTRLHGGALLLTLAGAVLTTNFTELRSGAISLTGVGLALLAAVAHGLYIVAGEKIAGKLTATSATTLTRVAILLGSLALNPRVFAELPAVTWGGWLICVVAAAVSGVAPFLFLNRGIALIGANRAAIASVAELPFALALGLLFQGDLIRPAQWAGAALIIAAVVVSQRQSDGSYGKGPIPNT